MINSTDAYKAAIVADWRKIMARAVVDLIDPDIVYGTAVAQTEDAYSKSTELHDKNFDSPKRYATLETNRWALDGTFDIYPDDPESAAGKRGYLSAARSGTDGAFTQAQYIEMQFSNVSVLQACAVYFPDNNYDGFPVDFTVEVKQGGTAYFTQTFTENDQASVSMDGFTVYNPDAIRVTVTKWSRADRKMRVIQIVPGIYEIWDNHIVAELSINQQVNFACASLPYGTCSIKMDNFDRRFEPRNKSGLFQSIEERQAVSVSLGVSLPDGSAEYKRVGVFYQYSGGWKTGDNGLSMQWDLVDIIGLLAGRDFIAPSTLPTTLSGWVAALAAQLGVNFANLYHVDPDYAGLACTVSSVDELSGKKCGDILRYICMVTGTFPRADAETGHLTVEPLWNQGNYASLDNMSKYPVMKANDDLAAVIFKLYDGNDTTYTVSGNSTSSSNTLSIDNPFIHTAAQALTAARQMISQYGGNQIEVSERGDMTNELGDVSFVQLNESAATSARRSAQAFAFSGGIMKDLSATLIQADGSFLYNSRVILTGSGSWTAPSGKTSLRIILVGGGNGGTDGADGGWDKAGEDGTNGLGGKVFSQAISINDGQSFSYSCGAGGTSGGGIGGDTAFGAYSSAAGARYNGYTDIANGDVFARDGVTLPLNGSGDGGKAGSGGAKGNQHDETYKVYTLNEDGRPWTETKTRTSVDNYPGEGAPGVTGGAGCIVIYYES